MKKIAFIAFSALVVLATSCLKDKDYEGSKYGINLDLGEKSVSFAKAPSLNLGANLTTASVTYKVVLIQSSAADAPTEDIPVTVAFKPSLVTGTTYTPLPAGALVLPSSFKIAKGKILDTLPLVFPNSSTLDLTKTYAVGLTITSAGAGYKFGGSKNDLLLIINLKNQYDGLYDANGYFYHPSAARVLHEDKELTTTGPTSVLVGLGDLGGSGYQAILTINPDNSLTITPAPGAVGTPYIVFTSGLPTTSPGYTPQWAGSSQCNNTYDPVTKTFKVRYGYVGGTGYRVTEELITLK
jgi:Domain of unknown function (DUF1735)/Domain of unknown function (DUF4361)